MDKLYFTTEDIPVYEGTYSGSAYFNNSFCHEAKDKIYISEGIDFEPDADKKGGIIVFSTDVNALKLSDNKILNWLKQRIKTILNRVKRNKKLDTIADKHNLVGWSVGNFLHGRYKGKNNKVYDEKSTSIEIIGVNTDELIKIAEELCIEFIQETVLVKDYSTGRIFFVNAN